MQLKIFKVETLLNNAFNSWVSIMTASKLMKIKKIAACEARYHVFTSFNILEEVHLIGTFLFEAIFINSQSKISFTL